LNTVSNIQKVARNSIHKRDNAIKKHLKPELNPVWFHYVFWNRNVL
jgi:hypothetical protein